MIDRQEIMGNGSARQTVRICVEISKSLLPAEAPLPASKTKLRQLSSSVTRSRTRQRMGWRGLYVAARRKAQRRNRRIVIIGFIANGRGQSFRPERKTGSQSRARRQRTEVQRQGKLCFAPLCAVEERGESTSRLLFSDYVSVAFFSGIKEMEVSFQTISVSF